MSETVAGSRAARLLGLALLLLLPARPADGQQPPEAPVTLTGVVRDGATGTAVSGALVAVERGPRALTDSTGAFRIAGVPTGRQRLSLQRFGYRTLTLELTVADPPARLELEMQVDPIALEGLTTSGTANVAQSGTVYDERTGEPLSWAGVTLMEGAVREAARASADEVGVFQLPRRPTGDYFLLVERLGYESQYVPVRVTAPPEPVEVRLRPDSVLMAGIASFDQARRSRRNASAFLVRTFDEAALRYSRTSGVGQFLQYYGSFTPCMGSTGTSLCYPTRGTLVDPTVLIDEMRWDMDYLDSFLPDEIYSIEVFRCGSAVRVHAYTYAFMERMGRRPRAMFPSCTGLM